MGDHISPNIAKKTRPIILKARTVTSAVPPELAQNMVRVLHNDRVTLTFKGGK